MSKEGSRLFVQEECRFRRKKKSRSTAKKSLREPDFQLRVEACAWVEVEIEAEAEAEAEAHRFRRKKRSR